VQIYLYRKVKIFKNKLAESQKAKAIVMGILTLYKGLFSPLYLSAAAFAWLAMIALYRRFLHPLAKIPGPFLAAITHFYIVYFNLFNGKSQFYLQVEKLHEEYGKQLGLHPHGPETFVI